MNVFISWSGDRSRAVAFALKEWLSDLLQSATTWMSEHDIDAGVRWSHRLSKVLEDSNLGVICLTPENQKSAWILFEAGALSKSLQESRLIPFLIGMSPHDVEPPLSQFQSVQADQAGTLKLIESVNACCAEPLPADRLKRLFNKFWPDLECQIRAAVSLVDKTRSVPARSERDVLNEVLDTVRSLAKPESLPHLEEDVVTIEIDSRPLLGVNGRVGKFTVDQSQALSDFLDRIYFLLNRDQEEEVVPAYTYGQTWVLKNLRSSKVYDDIGVEYCRSGGARRDNTPVYRIGIEHGDRLAVLKCKEKDGGSEAP